MFANSCSLEQTLKQVSSQKTVHGYGHHSYYYLCGVNDEQLNKRWSMDKVTAPANGQRRAHNVHRSNEEKFNSQAKVRAKCTSERHIASGGRSAICTARIAERRRNCQIFARILTRAKRSSTQHSYSCALYTPQTVYRVPYVPEETYPISGFTL